MSQTSAPVAAPTPGELAAGVVTPGHIFTTEIDAAAVERLAAKARQSGLTNLTAMAHSATIRIS